MTSYDRIGVGYAKLRRPDPRIAASIHAALGAASTVVNVGAGAGSYEPDDRWVLAVEPSAVMAGQRPPGSAPVLVASAESLPLADGTVDAAMATLSLHHWRDWRAGVAEMRRVARQRVVILTWDPDACDFWLTREYVPWLLEWDATRFPTIAEMCGALPGASVEPVPVPHDCEDGFLGAWWARPEAYLDPEVQRSNSLFALGPDRPRLEAALERLAEDLRSGAWDARHSELRTRESADLGYRLVTARRRSPTPPVPLRRAPRTAAAAGRRHPAAEAVAADRSRRRPRLDERAVRSRARRATLDGPMTDTGRAERLARNEARWRELNAELEHGLSDVQRDPDERAAFVCECARPDCVQMVKLPLDEYKRWHRDDRHFVVLPGHEYPEVETVLEANEDYFVIEKRDIGQVSDVVERL